MKTLACYFTFGSRCNLAKTRIGLLVPVISHSYCIGFRGGLGTDSGCSVMFCPAAELIKEHKLYPEANNSVTF